MSTDETPTPVSTLQIVRGAPSADDVAVIAAVVSALGSGAPEEQSHHPMRGWANPRRRLQRPAVRGDGWTRI